MDNKDTKNSEEMKVSTSAEDLLNDVVGNEKSGNSSYDKKEKKPKEKKQRNFKKLKHTTMATVLTCVFVAAVVLVNVIATMLFDRFPITIDLTDKKIYSVSDKVKDYIKSVDTDVLVTIFAKENTFTSLNDYTKQADEMLKSYSRENSHISYRYVDIDSNPEIVSDYEDVQAYDIVFETTAKVEGKDYKRTRTISVLDLVNWTDEFTQQLTDSGMSIDTAAQQVGGAINLVYYYGQYIASSNVDEAYASALMTVTDPNPVYVTFLTGRGELDSLEYFQKLLIANGYNVNSINISSEEIPSDTDVIVIPAPKTDYLEDEVDKISKFLNNDGKLGKQLLYCANIAQGETPNLDEFLAEYGIEVGTGVVMENDSQYMFYHQSSIYVQAANKTDLTDKLDNFKVNLDNAGIVMGQSRPVSALFDEQDNVGATEYLQSTNDAAVYDADELLLGNPKQIASGKQGYMTVGTKVTSDSSGEKYSSSILAVGSTNMLQDDVLQYDQFQNREYILGVLNSITFKTEGITIEPKVIKANLIDITEKQSAIFKWTFMAVIPVIILIVGLVVWARRKNR